MFKCEKVELSEFWAPSSPTFTDLESGCHQKSEGTSVGFVTENFTLVARRCNATKVLQSRLRVFLHNSSKWKSLK